MLLHTNTKFGLINNVLHGEITIPKPKQMLIKPVCSSCTSEKKSQPLSPPELTRDQQAKLSRGGFVASPGSYTVELLSAGQCGPQHLTYIEGNSVQVSGEEIH